ncbi:MAG: hypothetical protein PVH88_23350 [Ignavibacteria bacterium]|jgi:hypothetical protein
MDFANEKKIINETYSEMIEIILNKPKNEDYEKMKIYFENVTARMNDWTKNLNKVKEMLEDKEPVKDITADNRPA